MSDLVVDASVTLKWFMEDEFDRAYSLSILAGLSQKRASVPALWGYEVANALVVAQRRGRLSGDDLFLFLDRLSRLPIDILAIESGEITELAKLAQAHRLTAYDAAYLALAMRLRAPLATYDESLRAAAVASGVAVA